MLELELEFAALFRREKPDVVVTFHGSGISYHPDHRVVYLAAPEDLEQVRAERSPLIELTYNWDGEVYQVPPRESEAYADWPREIYSAPPDEITTIVDTEATADTKWEAIQAHDTQQYGPPFRLLYEGGAFRHESFVRVFPSPRPGEKPETDLLEGLS